MSEPTPPSAATSPDQAVDIVAVLAAMQDQLDALAIAVTAQQETIAQLQRQVRERPR